MTSDPRGPHRVIIRVEEHTDRTDVHLDCGHVGKMNQIFHYKVGNELRCFQCGPHGIKNKD